MRPASRTCPVLVVIRFSNRESTCGGQLSTLTRRKCSNGEAVWGVACRQVGTQGHMEEQLEQAALARARPALLPALTPCSSLFAPYLLFAPCSLLAALTLRAHSSSSCGLSLLIRANFSFPLTLPSHPRPVLPFGCFPHVPAPSAAAPPPILFPRRFPPSRPKADFPPPPLLRNRPDLPASLLPL